MRKNIRREIAQGLANYVAMVCPDTPISYKFLSSIFADMQTDLEQKHYGEVRNEFDYSTYVNTRWLKVQSLIYGYRDEIIAGIEAHEDQAKVLHLRSFFIHRYTGRVRPRLPKPEVTLNTIERMQAQIDHLIREVESQTAIILEQDAEIKNLKFEISYEHLLDRFKKALAKSEDPPEPEIMQKERYHVHGLLARQQREIERRFPSLNITFTIDTVNPSQIVRCKYIFAMTDFMKHTDEGLMRSRVGDRYIRVSGGLSSLIASINKVQAIQSEKN